MSKSLSVGVIWAVALLTPFLLAPIDLRLSIILVPVSVVALGVTLLYGAQIQMHTAFDMIMILWFVSSLLSTVFAYNVTTAIPQMILRVVFASLYITFRCCIALRRTANVVTAAGVGMTIHAMTSLVFFAESYRKWETLHFSRLIDFRAYVTLTSPGLRPGNYNAVYLVSATLGLYELSHKRAGSWAPRIIAIVATVTSCICVALSFSRSLYLSLGIIILLLRRQRLTFEDLRITLRASWIIPISLGSIVVALNFKPILRAMCDTLLMNVRPSQSLSAEGRLRILESSFKLMRHAGFWGIGIGNYALAAHHSNLTSTINITIHSFNIPMETLVEQGYIGLVSITLVIACMAKIVATKAHTVALRVLSAGCGGLLIYSMNQTFIVVDAATATILALFCALIVDSWDLDAR